MRQLDGGFVLQLDWRVDTAPTGPVSLSLGGGALDLGPVLRAAKPGEPVLTRIPLRCFKDAGGDLAAVGTPLRLRADTGLVVTIRNIRLDSAGLPVPCPAKAAN